MSALMTPADREPSATPSLTPHSSGESPSLDLAVTPGAPETSFLRTGSGLWIPEQSFLDESVEPGEWRIDPDPGIPVPLRAVLESGERTPEASRDYLPYLAALGIGLSGALLMFVVSGALDSSRARPLSCVPDLPAACPATILRPGNDLEHVERTFSEIRRASRSWSHELKAIWSFLEDSGLRLDRLEITSGDLLCRKSARVQVDAMRTAPDTMRVPDEIAGAGLRVTRVVQRKLPGDDARMSFEMRSTSEPGDSPGPRQVVPGDAL